MVTQILYIVFLRVALVGDPMDFDPRLCKTAPSAQYGAVFTAWPEENELMLTLLKRALRH